MGYSVFISYRREGAAELAQLLYTKLSLDGYAPFFDVEEMNPGKFNEQLYARIEECEAFLLVLPPHALDPRESGEDWVRLEIAHALKKNKRIVPVMMRGFQWPETLPEDIADVRYYHGANASDMELFDGVYAKILKLLKIEPKVENRPDASGEWLRVARFLLESREFEAAKKQYEQVLLLNPTCSSAYIGLTMAECGVKDRDEFREYYEGDFVEQTVNLKLAREYANNEDREYLDSLQEPVCAFDQEKAVGRCDGCGALLCSACGFSVGDGAEEIGDKPWVEGKVLCPRCMDKLYAHCRTMKTENSVAIWFKLLVLFGVIGLTVWLSCRFGWNTLAVVCVVLGVIWGFRYGFGKEESKDDESGFGVLLMIAICAILSPLITLFYIGKRIHYLFRMSSLIKSASGDSTPRQKVDAYYKMVRVTRKLGNEEPKWEEHSQP